MGNAISGYKTLMGTGKLTGVDMSAAIAARTKFMRVSEFNVEPTHGEEMDPSGTYHSPEFAHLGRADVRWTCGFPVYPEGAIEHLLLSVMGDVATSGGGDPFTHTFTKNDTPTSQKAYLGMERPIGGSSDADTFNARVRRLEVRGGANSYLMGSASGVGSKLTIGSKTSPTLSTATPFPGRHATVLTLDAVTALRLREFSWFVDNGAYEDGYDGNSRFRKTAEDQEFEAGFEATVIYEGPTELKKFLDSAGASSMSDTASTGSVYAANVKSTSAASPERSIALDLPRVFLQAADVVHRGRDVYTQRVRGRALHNATKAAEVILKNSVSSI